MLEDHHLLHCCFHHHLAAALWMALGAVDGDTVGIGNSGMIHDLQIYPSLDRLFAFCLSSIPFLALLDVDEIVDEILDHWAYP